ncbi:hypothetical protein LTR91_012689 [Friedmanniomyces endolithicus]|uniref:Uncharacterized protein n=2 Tax=Friedmanniomyces endolithicus TaxID=329885 RepID=A0AAN6KFC9_9PEZI|nr:hypothetical protein LTS09_006558 [Friedmanniomyces endolithicus]KAK0356637.1 hypothetical protein LTR94_003491 [Friedmanniomyces endolithicus]KAK0792628.1 hypothetical protein LTR59_008438 [Friedmanniomyces endolithicus]KAK0794680.1 hypothetical protein LTR38_009177 [Friedmanniomyces endolithicus]KAK0801953.1 hypothetical protein LTR75_008423 [Friedmanniomyces endolithicus]
MASKGLARFQFHITTWVASQNNRYQKQQHSPSRHQHTEQYYTLPNSPQLSIDNMQFTTVLASLLASSIAVVSAQVNATSAPQFNPACYPTMPGGGYTFGPTNPFPTPSNRPNPSVTSTTVTAYVSASTGLPVPSNSNITSTTGTAYVSASTGMPVHTTNGTYRMPSLTSTSTSTFIPSLSAAGPSSSTTQTSIITNYASSSPTSFSSSASQATVSAAAATPAPFTGAGASLELGAEGFFALGLAALIFAAAL